MSKKIVQEAQNSLILNCQRLMEAFAKSDDERDFYLDRKEGFLIYVDLDKGEELLVELEKQLKEQEERYCMIPKLTYYETKKIMEGFINEKVYDIDTKEKLLDIIQSKEARENFLEFLYDHHAEFDKWQQYYIERSRIKIIEWLRLNKFHFVFEEDLELPQSVIEKLKRNLFNPKTTRDLDVARKVLSAKAKSYYSNEALNPRPKRGRPPKQAHKLEVEPQATSDIFLSVPPAINPFLFLPDPAAGAAMSFSSKFEEKEDLQRRHSSLLESGDSSSDLNLKLAAIRSISSKWAEGSNASGSEAASQSQSRKGALSSSQKKTTKKSASASTTKEKKKSATGVSGSKATAAKKEKKATSSTKGTKATKTTAGKTTKTTKTKTSPPKAPKKAPLRSILKKTT